MRRYIFAYMQMLHHHRYTGHQGAIYALCDDLHGGFISGGGDRIVARWQLNDNPDGEIVARAGDAVYALHLTPYSGQLMAGTGKGGVHVIDLIKEKELRLLQLHESPVFSIVASPDNKFICTTGGDGLLNILRSDDFSVVKRSRLTENKLRTISFHPTLPFALAACGDGSIVELDTINWEPVSRFQAHQPGFSVNCICFSPDGNQFLTGSRDAHLHVYETSTRKQLMSIPAHNYAIYEIGFDPTGKYFATASRDKTVKIWDYNSMGVIERLAGNDGKGHINSVNTLLWMKNGTLLTAGDDRAIQSWIA